MKKPSLIVVSGFPCTGKTTIAEKLSQELSIPLISRDDYKECLFDSLGSKDRQWSRLLGSASYSVIYKTAERLLAAGTTLILESNFHPDFAVEVLNNFQKDSGCLTIQLFCKADRDVLIDRFIKRSASGERHMGHQDHLNIDEIRQRYHNVGNHPLALDAELLEIDTTEFSLVDFPGILKFIRKFSNL
jgi:predicted kinase